MQPPRELDDRLGPAAEPFEDGSPRRIREGRNGISVSHNLP